jgi:hypothetical protein
MEHGRPARATPPRTLFCLQEFEVRDGRGRNHRALLHGVTITGLP